MSPIKNKRPASYTTIKGKVIDTETKQGISGVLIKITYPWGKTVLTEKTDAAGNYYIKKKSLWGKYYVTASKSGYNRVKKSRSFHWGKTDAVNFNLEPIKRNPYLAALKIYPYKTLTNRKTQIIRGRKKRGASVWINNKEAVKNNPRTNWSAEVNLMIEGNNLFKIKQKDISGSESRPIIININRDTTAPQAEAGENKTVNEGENVTFDANASRDNIGITKYTWNFGDGKIGEGITAIHSYAVPGTYTVTLTVTDTAGNRANGALQITVTDTTARNLITYLKGGEVETPGGRVKLKIPPKTLKIPLGKDETFARYISVRTIDKSVVADILEGKEDTQNIVGAVEFLPVDTEFIDGPNGEKVKVIYKLEKMLVAGTEVKLVLYNAEKGKEYTTTSRVSTDGETVTFQIKHFSTYAALQTMISSGAPIGGGVQIPLPDMFTGAYSHAIPLTIPPGRAGMQPTLSITYRSSTPNSWVGVGFSLNPGHIVRSTRLGPPAYNDTQDTFYLVSDGGTTELVHLIDNLYQAKIETTFTKFYKEPDDSWRAISKDSSQIYFGKTTQSKETGKGGTYSWQITKTQDTNGNYIEYNYIKDQGKTYLDTIKYTGHKNISPTNTIEFNLEDRPDITSSYISGTRIATTKRLKEIKVRGYSGDVWTYKLEYEESRKTNRSLLKRVRQIAADGKELPARIFGYQGTE